MKNTIQDYINDENKYEYVDARLRSVAYHQGRIKKLEDDLLELEVYVQQGFSHGKSFDAENVPQKHYRGDMTEKRLLYVIEKKDAIEAKISREREQIQDVEEWLEKLPEAHNRLIKERYFKKLSFSDLAFRHGMVSINTIRERLRRILLTFPEDEDLKDGELILNLEDLENLTVIEAGC